MHMYVLCSVMSCTDQYDEHCLLSTTALTVDNILKELKQVKWKTLQFVLELPNSEKCKIEEIYAGETERKREGVKYWLWNHAYASWRLLITRFDQRKEYAVADQIRGYAEKLTGMSGIIIVYTKQFQDGVCMHACIKISFHLSSHFIL